MARLLAERLEAEGESAGAEISLGELLDRYVPYGVARGSLELTTKSEYDLLVLTFLADDRLTALGDPEVGEIASEELETPEPGLEPLSEHAGATLRLDLATISGGYRGSGPGATPPAAEEEGEAEPPEGAGPVESGGWDPTGGVHARPPSEPDGPDSSTGPSADRTPESGSAESAGTAESRECRSCGGELPVVDGVAVRYCPHCGAARPERTCPECDAELKPEWTYCPACGARASPSGGGGAA